VASRKPGDSVTVDIIRGTERLTYKIVLIEKPGNDPIASRTGDFENHPFRVRLQDLDERTRSIHGLHEGVGIMVERVDPDGPAALAKPYPLMAGDIILEIADGINVATVSDMEEKLDGLRESSALLLFISRFREGRAVTNYTVIEPEW